MENGARREGRGSRSVASRACRLLCAALTAALAVAPSAGWCDLVFKDVAPGAHAVVIARYTEEGAAPPRLDVEEVLKGKIEAETLSLGAEELDSYHLKNRDQLVMALSRDNRPVRTVVGTGACTAVSILPIRKGKLLGRDRLDYDLSRKTMTLEQLREELIRLFATGS